jgi:hypothetical protein
MKPTSHHAPEEMHNDDTAHEHSDINIGALTWSMVVMFGTVIVTAGLMYALFIFLEGDAKARDPKLSPLTMPATVMPKSTTSSPFFGGAPEPKLMTGEPAYLKEVRTELQDELHTAGWIDEKAGVARIPIDQAKALVLKDGLPVRPDPVSDSRLGGRTPALGESSSGRNITAKPGAEAPAPPATPAPAAPAAAGHEGHK